MDAGALAAVPTTYHVKDAGAASAFNALGISFTGYNAAVFGGQAYQIPTAGRTRLIVFGAGVGGQITINFATPVNGIAWRSNNGDGGSVIGYTGLDQTGSTVGTGSVASGGFGGLVSDTLIRSAKITCDFNGDLVCGAYDIQFGTLAVAAPAVPEPASWALMIGGMGFAGFAMRRRTAALRLA
ncbi:MAG: PEP-CTERM sorting domain-containing protein [Sphingobium sp.]|nr:PEP-CTERM sorting domain-containing protein [Sphingobium sp.]